MKRLPAKLRKRRSDFVKNSQFCQVCCKRPAVHCHEIARGVHRKTSVYHRCCWLAVCLECHDAVDNLRDWPISKQLACKLIHDPMFFDLEQFNRIRDRDPQAITLSDVCFHLQLKDA